MKWAAVLLPALALLAVVTFARTTPPIVTDSDLAVGELYTDLAAEGRLRVGPYSRFGWHHPGPMYFYTQAPLYVLSGRRAAALYAGALAINLGALVILTWVMTRESRGPLTPLTIAACLVFCLRAPRFLASPWTAHIPILPLLAFVAVCAATPATPRLAPLLVVLASFVVQTHVGLAPVVGALLIATLTVLFLDRRRAPAHHLFILAVSLGIGLLVWLPTIADAATHRGGNAAALLRFFAARQPDHRLAEALSGWSYGLTGVLRPDFDLPWGAHFTATNLRWLLPCALAEILLIAVIARRDAVAGRRFDARFAAFTVIASIAGLWSLTRVRDDILDHEIFWMAAIGSLNLAIVGAAGVRSIASTAFREERVHRASSGMAAALLLLLAAVGLRHLHDFTAFERRRVERAQIVDAYAAIRDDLRSQGIRRPLISIEAPVWSQAAGILLRLRRQGSGVAVADEWIPMFTDAFAADGREDAVVTIGRGRARRESADLRDGTAVVVFESGAMHVWASRTPRSRGVR